MKIKILVILLLIMAVSFSSVYAIERVSKGEARKVDNQTTISEQGDTSRDTLQERKTSRVEVRQKIEERKEKYDNFIDKNNNGIDDRLEKQRREKKVFKKEIKRVKQSEVRQSEVKQSKVIQSEVQKINTTKSQEKKDIKETKEEPEVKKAKKRKR